MSLVTHDHQGGIQISPGRGELYPSSFDFPSGRKGIASISRSRVPICTQDQPSVRILAAQPDEKLSSRARPEVPCTPSIEALKTGAVRYNSDGIAMTSGRSGTELAVLAVVCVLTIFLFPAGQGPYSAVHGPASALQAARAAARLRVTIVQSALKSLRNFPFPILLALFCLATAVAECRSIRLAECDSVLRC